MIRLEYLEWDSVFFEKKIFRCTIDGSEDIDLVKKELLKSKADLCYIISKENLSINDNDLFFLADKKVMFFKNIFPSQSRIIQTNIKSTKTYTFQLYNLALLSGRHSRFRTDKFLFPKFNLMYKTWLEKSLSREIANEVFVYEKNNEQLGFVTIKKTNLEAVVGLIAVDEASQGKNIGSDLLRQIESWCCENKITSLDIATQLDNEQACGFYKKNGYEIKQIEYIYHCYKQ